MARLVNSTRQHHVRIKLRRRFMKRLAAIRAGWRTKDGRNNEPEHVYSGMTTDRPSVQPFTLWFNKLSPVPFLCAAIRKGILNLILLRHHMLHRRMRQNFKRDTLLWRKVDVRAAESEEQFLNHIIWYESTAHTPWYHRALYVRPYKLDADASSLAPFNRGGNFMGIFIAPLFVLQFIKFRSGKYYLWVGARVSRRGKRTRWAPEILPDLWICDSVVKLNWAMKWNSLN